jgi:hypothetical protein
MTKNTTKTFGGVPIDVMSNELFIAVYCTRYKEGKLSAATIQRIEAIPGWDWNFNEFSTPMPVLRRLIRELGDVIHRRWFLAEPA